MSNKKKTTQNDSDKPLVSEQTAGQPEKKSGKNTETAPLKKDSIIPVVVILVIFVAAILAGIIFIFVRGNQIISPEKTDTTEARVTDASGDSGTSDSTTSGTENGTPSEGTDPASGTDAVTPAAPVKIPDSAVKQTAERMLEVADTNPARLENDAAYQTSNEDFKYYQKMDDGTGNDTVMLSQITDVHEKNGQKYCTQIDYFIYTDETAYLNAKKLFDGDDDAVFYDDKLCIAQIHETYYETSQRNAELGQIIE